MKKQKTTKLFLNKVKISKIQNASLLFGGTAAPPAHEADNGESQNDSHTNTTTETTGCDSNTSIGDYYTCSLGAGEVTNG